MNRINSELKCPTCGSMQIKSHYQLHVGRGEDGLTNGQKDEFWTTRKFREENNLQPDKVQILLVPDNDDTWYTCKACNTEFDNEGNKY